MENFDAIKPSVLETQGLARRTKARRSDADRAGEKQGPEKEGKELSSLLADEDHAGGILKTKGDDALMFFVHAPSTPLHV